MCAGTNITCYADSIVSVESVDLTWWQVIKNDE